MDKLSALKGLASPSLELKAIRFIVSLGILTEKDKIFEFFLQGNAKIS